MISGHTTVAQSFDPVDVVVRVGEYNNKPGKRVYLSQDEFFLANGLDIKQDNEGYYVSEYDINYKLASKVAKRLEEKGVKVKLQIANSKSQDLNAAGRLAMKHNPKVYLSIHHNSFESDSSGYFLMTNEGNAKAKDIAQRISDNLVSNPKRIPQRENRIQDGYIGEMNETNSTINILLEAGFYSNKSELSKITSDEQVEFIANKIAEELFSVIK